MEKTTILGVGAALIDLLIEETDSYLAKYTSAKGGMSLVTDSDLQKMLQDSTQSPKIVPGGSACNTLVGLGKLGAQARFIGQCGLDKWSEIFEKGLQDSKVQTFLATGTQPTGRVLSVVSPDAQRTMFTFLGAAAELKADQIKAESFENVGLLHLEGYLLYNKPVVDELLKQARARGVKISLDLASFQVVEHLRTYIDEILEQGIDILIANEDEAAAYTGEKDELIGLELLREKADLVVYKLGKRGARIAPGNRLSADTKNNTLVEVKAREVKAIDTTGAGDLWAAGFLYGYIQGWNLEKCGKAASLVASEVVQVMGACIPEEGWARIHKGMEIL